MHPGNATDLGIRRGGDGALVGGNGFGGAPQLALHLGQADQGRHRPWIERHRFGEHRRRFGGIARIDQLGQREQAVSALRQRSGGGAAAHHLGEPIEVAPGAKNPFEHLEVGFGLRLEREHLLEAATGHLVVAHLVGVKAGRLPEGVGRPSRRLRQSGFSGVELGRRARVSERLTQTRQPAQRRQEGRIRFDGAREVGVGARQIAGSEVSISELPEQGRPHHAFHRQLRHSAAGQDGERPVRRARGQPIELGQRLLGWLCVDGAPVEGQRLRHAVPRSRGDAHAGGSGRPQEGGAGLALGAGLGELLQGQRHIGIAPEPASQGERGIQSRSVVGSELHRSRAAPAAPPRNPRAASEIEQPPEGAVAAAADGRGPEPLDLAGRHLAAPPQPIGETFPGQIHRGQPRHLASTRGGDRPFDGRQRLPPVPELPLERLRLKSIGGRLVGGIRQRLPQAAERHLELAGAIGAREQPSMVGDGRHVGGIVGEGPARGSEGDVEPSETPGRQASRFQLEDARVGRVGLGGGLTL